MNVLVAVLAVVGASCAVLAPLVFCYKEARLHSRAKREREGVSKMPLTMWIIR